MSKKPRRLNAGLDYWKNRAVKRLAHIELLTNKVRDLKSQVRHKQNWHKLACGHIIEYSGSYWNVPNLKCEVCDAKR